MSGPRRLFQIGNRWFAAIGPKHLSGGGLEYLRRFLPFGLHRVDVGGLSSDEAAFRLYQHLHRSRSEWAFLAVGILEEGRQPTGDYASELTDYLSRLDDPDAIMARNMAMANLLKALAMVHGDTTFLQLMRRRA